MPDSCETERRSNYNVNYPIKEIVESYDHWLVRLYSRIRFQILHQRFMREIGQYVPPNGHILDVGCGFGLFALSFASARKDITIHGIDRNDMRIQMAQRAATKLDVTNVSFRTGDVTDVTFEDELSCAYMLDIVHHIPPHTVTPLLTQVHKQLTGKDSVLIIKDINTYPAYKRHFTWLLDKLMDYKTPVHYWKSSDLVALLEDIGFSVYAHEMVDYLPYSHILYICHKKPTSN